MIKTNKKFLTRKDTISYYLDSEIADEFEKHLQANAILSYASMENPGASRTIVIEKKYADRADKFFE